MKVVIFSNKRISGLMGSYMNPKYFNGNFEEAEVVMTDDAEIAKEAEEQGLQVYPIKGAKQTPVEITTTEKENKVVKETPPADNKITPDESILKPIETKPAPKPRGRKPRAKKPTE